MTFSKNILLQSLLFCAVLLQSTSSFCSTIKDKNSFPDNANLTKEIDSLKTEKTQNTVEYVNFHGNIIDEKSQKPLSGAQISFFSLGSTYKTYSLVNGSFSMEIPKKLINDKNVIRVLYDKARLAQTSKTKTRLRVSFYSDTPPKDYIFSKDEMFTALEIAATPVYGIVCFKTFPYNPKIPSIAYINGVKTSYNSVKRKMDKREHGFRNMHIDYYIFSGAVAQALTGEELNRLILIYSDKNPSYNLFTSNKTHESIDSISTISYTEIKGKIITSQYEHPLQNVKISFFTLDKVHSVLSDIQGEFVLIIPTIAVDDDNIIRVSFGQVKLKANKHYRPSIIFSDIRSGDYLFTSKQLNDSLHINVDNPSIAIGGRIFSQHLNVRALKNGVLLDSHKLRRQIKNGKIKSPDPIRHYFTALSASAIYGESIDGLILVFGE